MKLLALIFLVYCSICNHAQIKNPFLTLKYDSLVMYHYSPPHDSTYIIDKRGRLNPHVKSRVRLDDATAKDFNTRIGLPESYGGMRAKCFMPHLAFVYYRNETPVANIIICLGCNYFIPSIDVPAQKNAKWAGMSPEFKRYVSNQGGK